MGASAEPAIDVRRAADRMRTRADGVDTWHSFSFGGHYDPANTHHGLLMANNEHVVEVGAGFGSHDHQDVEIVTWVLRGRLAHEDSTGHRGVVYPSLAQRMSAGTGVRHSERNAAVSMSEGSASGEPAHFVQMWVAPGDTGLPPVYEQRDVDGDLQGGGLVTVASGMPRDRDVAALSLSNQAAALHAARPRPGQSLVLPDAPFVHVFVARGAVVLEEVGRVVAGDAVRLRSTGGPRLTAGDDAEVLVWEMHAPLHP